MTVEPQEVGMNVHPAAELFPLMEGDDFTRLVESMRDFGFDAKYPILRDQAGRIIDGRNRERAAGEAVVDPIYTTYYGDDPFGEAVRANVDRRHLTPTQIAAALVKSDELKEAAAKAKLRQYQAPGRPQGEKSVSAHGRQQTEPAESPPVGKAAVEAAKKYGISPRTVERVQRAAKEDPEILDQMLKGEVSARGAEEKIRHLQVVKDEPKPPSSTPADVPMPAGMKRSPKRPFEDTCRRATTTLHNAVEIATPLAWDSLSADVRSELVADLRATRTALTRIINQLEGRASA